MLNPKTINKIYSILDDPDSLYSSSTNSITFIYNPENNRFYSKPYPATHHDIRIKDFELKKFRYNEESIDAGLILGRLGIEKHGSDDYPVIAFWNVYFENNDLVDCLNAIIKEYPEYGNPYTLVMRDKGRTYDSRNSNLKATILKNIPGVQITNAKSNSNQQKPECNVTLDVLGQPTKLDTILSNFHMVKDNRLPAMKSAICSQGVNMKDDLEKAGCDMQVRMLDDLIQKSNCNSNEYENLKSAGRTNRKQYLKGVFSNPERAEKEFRTQKDIDSAWDELQRKEHRMVGFAEWLNKYS